MKPDKAQSNARDGALMRRLARGDEAAAREIVTRFAKPLGRFAGGMLNDPAEGEDVAHEAIMRLWRGAGDWRPDGAIGGWLRRSAYRLAIDRIRRRKRMAPDPEAAGLDTTPDTRADPEAAAFGGEVGDRVRRALDRLPERQRAALVLAQFDGLTGAEIAEALDSTPEAVESLLARARRQLRRDLADAYDDARGVELAARRGTA